MKRKIFLAIVLSFIGVAAETRAQSNDTNNISVGARTNSSGSVLVTNWAAAPLHYRTVNGKLYNTKESVLWNDVSKLIFGRARYGEIEVETIANDYIVCAVFETEDGLPPLPRLYGGKRSPSPEVLIKRIVIYHHPRQEKLTTGELLRGCVAMRVDNWKTNGVSLEAYDCGSLYTNKIPVISRVHSKTKE